MAQNNILADALARIRNAYAVSLPMAKGLYHSNFVVEILKVLENEGFIQSFEIVGEKKKTINVKLKYSKNTHGKPAISKMRLLSSGSKKQYIQYDTVLRAQISERSLLLLSTNQGIKTLYEARQNKLGGLLIMEVL